MTLNLIKPPALKAGDTVAAVSLSWGGAGDPEFLWRYRQGVEQLEQAYGLADRDAGNPGRLCCPVPASRKKGWGFDGRLLKPGYQGDFLLH